MLFNSYIFIFLFLPVTLFIFFAIGSKGYHQVAITWLVASSLFFYGWWNPVYLWLILGSILFNYALGLVLSDERRPKSWRKTALTFGICINLGAIGYFKYANFFIENMNAVVGTSWQMGGIFLPLAISFFTFQQIAYLVDAYKGLTREYNFLHYCLFVTFFPQLIAGPIVHHREVLPQFANSRVFRFCSTNLAIGLAIFAIGLFKKTIIADGVAVYATPVFTAAELGEPLSFIEAWGGALAYTFQLYFDFSGYSEMALGLGRMFGIRLPLNFFSPYKATSIIDFWQRWHMTLSRFLRNYLYIPLGGNRKGNGRRHINIMITMLLGGLWHGASWNFVLWGGLHGLYLGINHAWRALFSTAGQGSRATKTASWGLTFLATVIAWVFFRAESLDGAFIILSGMSGQHGIAIPSFYQASLGAAAPIFTAMGGHFIDGELPYFYGFQEAFALIGLLIAVVVMPNTYEFIIGRKHGMNTQGLPLTGKPFIRWRMSPFWGFAIGAAAALSLFGVFGEHEFLYFQF